MLASPSCFIYLRTSIGGTRLKNSHCFDFQYTTEIGPASAYDMVRELQNAKPIIDGHIAGERQRYGIKTSGHLSAASGAVSCERESISHDLLTPPPPPQNKPPHSTLKKRKKEKKTRERKRALEVHAFDFLIA